MILQEILPCLNRGLEIQDLYKKNHNKLNQWWGYNRY